VPPANTPGEEPPQYVAPGHFYSPVPSVEDIDRAIAARPLADSLLGIDLREDEQMRLLQRLAKFYPEIPFANDRSRELRFAFDNPSYSWCDGIILFCMIRDLEPRRIIEVGSGHTSCLILDTNELFFGGGIECTFVEPYPELLLKLLRPEEVEQTDIIARKLQETDPAIFASLKANDILFIDSSHVAKAGSDVQALFSHILPALSPGVVVHLHDIFAGFEYAPEWLREGRGWNEQYMLRAFLQFNAHFRIRLFTGHMLFKHPDFFRQHMPNCFRNGGGNFWMERASV
jgi:hypothetical protein